MEGSWIIMLSSALIGCFTVWLNVELCSDWLLHSAAQFSSSQEGNTGTYIYIYTFQYFLSQLYNWVIILWIKHRDQGASINMLGIETVLKCTIAFYFPLRDSRSHVLCFYYGAAILTTPFTRLEACQWCSRSVNHSPSSSVISPLCLCGKWNLL